jgi:biotin transport system substrate-specific component
MPVTIAPPAAPGPPAPSAPTRELRSRTRELVIAALVAALLMAVSGLALPIGVVPVTLQVFVVVLAALVLSPRWAAVSVGVYLLAGAVGLPVFSGMKGGLGVLIGPTGGYLWGFLLGAVAGSIARTALERATGRRGVVTDVPAAMVVVIGVYLAGWLQLGAVAHLAPGAAFAAGVLPFIALDAVKGAAAVAVAAGVRRARGLR